MRSRCWAPPASPPRPTRLPHQPRAAQKAARTLGITGVARGPPRWACRQCERSSWQCEKMCILVDTFGARARVALRTRPSRPHPHPGTASGQCGGAVSLTPLVPVPVWLCTPGLHALPQILARHAASAVGRALSLRLLVPVPVWLCAPGLHALPQILARQAAGAVGRALSLTLLVPVPAWLCAPGLHALTLTLARQAASAVGRALSLTLLVPVPVWPCAPGLLSPRGSWCPRPRGPSRTPLLPRPRRGKR